MKRTIAALMLAVALLTAGVVSGHYALVGIAHADGGDGGEG